ncbi:MAG: hypothetical protein FWC11_04175 [Firmicutes bacterium]|nr:hypothetical protein [Bacillota bacterium]MCL2256039.1 hypothetical protein [Bacillota bacterium]
MPTTFSLNAQFGQSNTNFSKELEMFNIAMENVKKHKSVKILCTGFSSTKAVNELQIDSTTVINFENGQATELYRNSYSTGSGVIGSRISRAKRFYFNAKDGKTYSEHTKKQSKNKDYVFENKPTVQSIEEFEEKFKREPESFFMYIVNSDTIANVEKPLEFCKKSRLHTFVLNLKPAPASVSADIETMDTGGLKDIKQEKIVVSFSIDENMRLVAYETQSTFRIDTGIPIFGKQTVNSQLNQTFHYYDTHQPMSWKGK